jgi:hypothetical protein
VRSARPTVGAGCCEGGGDDVLTELTRGDVWIPATS